MIEDRTKLLINLEVRVKQVMLLCNKLKQENNRLENELVVKKEELIKAKKELGLMNKKYDNLKTVRTITAASVDVETAQSKLSKLVREVDKCIGLLNK
ncbi:MAG: hypothetical protein PHO84_07400 [Dysgonamonadaceae bacterium]|jgi:Ser-tRNA(Ala) deacylase AlaX|nr:hypothetical protein [Dysgonamonadaceae bacterium]MDD3355610.1 hypothetical protein [Dysgonamonadaceae bacterium]MDD3727041.1 hypothetical protein [Dysgonamonadaceae bacterium]MDD4246963.1 hypothetical protein [Dysgonamonadaceae bacterium]MDD4605630.1 hypothetical protein [Dysgonamonadaceae bacterium]